MITSATYNNMYDISIVDYEDNGLYKISAYETPIQKKLSNQQKQKRNAVKYRNANAIELTAAYEVDGTRYMHVCV